jgi:hypothetical protein
MLHNDRKLCRGDFGFGDFACFEDFGSMWNSNWSDSGIGVWRSSFSVASVGDAVAFPGDLGTGDRAGEALNRGEGGGEADVARS